MPEADKKSNKQNFPKRLLSLLGISFPSHKKSNSNKTLTFDNESEIEEYRIDSRLPEQLSKRYKYEKTLGQGGYGTVYLVRDILIGRLVALKLLNPQLNQHPVIYQHFIQEARIAGQLDHENIVIIYNLEKDEGHSCIVMEYLAEGSLAMELENRGHFQDLEEALNIISDILRALSSAHKMHVIHRDIKPENILFDPKGRAKVSDFGIAHLPSKFGGVDSDVEYEAVGTPTYMSPEQINSDRNIDNRADLYSVGAILYEMLSGQKLYDFNDSHSIADARKHIVEHQAISLEKIKPELPKDLVDVIHKLTAKNPDDRYESAQETLTHLEKIRLEVTKKNSNTKSDFEITSSEALLEDVLRLLLVDGIMSPTERRELERRSKRLQVSREKARILEDKIRLEMELPSLESIEALEAAATAMAADGQLTIEEKEALEFTSRKLGIQDEERIRIQKDAINFNKAD